MQKRRKTHFIFILRLNWINQQDEIEGVEGDKKDAKKPTGALLFDDEIADSKANVKEKAEELRKQGCKYSKWLKKMNCDIFEAKK